MDRVEARLKILELAKPAATAPDIDRWLAAAGRLEAYVLGAGHAAEAPAETKPVKASTTKARATAE